MTGIAQSVQLMFRRPRREQFAALCYRVDTECAQPEILLLTSRDTGRWVIPKGWPMGSKPGHEVARQEAHEEAGVVGEPEPQPIGYFSYEKNLDHGVIVPCKVQVHALKVTAMVTEFKEMGKRKIEWTSPASAADRVQEPELKQLIQQFAKRFGEQAR
jgi:8-oxo-dGTP pyrophosphatase MutT (NUDIX family)